MNKKLIIFLIFFMLIFICLCGCSEEQNSEEKRFVGTWKMEEMDTTITFNSNGVISGLFGDEYEIKDNKLIILTRFAGTTKQEFYHYNFSNNDTKVVLLNIDTNVLHTLIKQ